MQAMVHSEARLVELCGLAEELGITPSVLRALVHLDERAPLSMRELAGLCLCDASYATTLVDALQRQGLAERRPHSSDRRIKEIVLTDRGRSVAGRVRRRAATPPPSFQHLSPAEQAQLLELLLKAEPEVETHWLFRDLGRPGRGKRRAS